MMLLTDEKPEISLSFCCMHFTSLEIFDKFLVFFWMGRHEGLERVDHRMWVKGHLDQPAQLDYIENTKIYSRNVKIKSTLYRIRSGFHLYMSAIPFFFLPPGGLPLTLIFLANYPLVSLCENVFGVPFFFPLCCGWELSSGQDRIRTFCFLSLYTSFH